MKDRHWRDLFVIGDGVLLGCSFDHPDRVARLASQEPADLALLLYDHDNATFAGWKGSGAREFRRLYWPTLAAPPDLPRFVALVGELTSAAREGAVVEVFCFGGHGRTGTVLASAAVAAGESSRSALARVRSQYCPRAVSTPELEEVVGFAARVLGTDASPELAKKEA